MKFFNPAVAKFWLQTYLGFGAGGTLLGTVVGGVFAAAATPGEIDKLDDKFKSEFPRDKQTSINYARFLANELPSKWYGPVSKGAYVGGFFVTFPAAKAIGFLHDNFSDTSEKPGSKPKA